jgi:hypothetical protein
VDLCNASASTQGEEVLIVNADAPFDDHLGPPLQFDGAFFGQNPDISLDATKGESIEASAAKKATYPPMIMCTPPCGP